MFLVKACTTSSMAPTMWSGDPRRELQSSLLRSAPNLSSAESDLFLVVFLIQVNTFTHGTVTEAVTHLWSLNRPGSVSRGGAVQHSFTRSGQF